MSDPGCSSQGSLIAWVDSVEFSVPSLVKRYITPLSTLALSRLGYLFPTNYIVNDVRRYMRQPNVIYSYLNNGRVLYSAGQLTKADMAQIKTVMPNAYAKEDVVCSFLHKEQVCKATMHGAALLLQATYKKIVLSIIDTLNQRAFEDSWDRVSEGTQWSFRPGGEGTGETITPVKTLVYGNVVTRLAADESCLEIGVGLISFTGRCLTKKALLGLARKSKSRPPPIPMNLYVNDNLAFPPPLDKSGRSTLRLAFDVEIDNSADAGEKT